MMTLFRKSGAEFQAVLSDFFPMDDGLICWDLYYALDRYYLRQIMQLSKAELKKKIERIFVWFL